MDIMELVAKLTLDSSEYEKGLKGAEDDVSKSSNKWAGKAASAAKGVGVAVAAVTTATAAAGGAFVKASGQVAEYGDQIDKESQKLGISAEAYQEWDAILQHTGGSINNMKPAMKTLAKEAVNNSEAFQQLGISQEEVANSSKEEIFEKTISALQKMPEGMERTRLATQLLGRSSVELGALLNTSAEDTEKMRQRVHELGGVMSDDAVKASARYQDSLQDMQTALEGTKRNIMSSFLPSLADVMDGLGNLFSGDSEKGLGQIKKGISGFIQNMTKAIPKFIEVAGTIVSALGQAIVENLPLLLEAGIKAILQIAKGLGEAAPELVPAIVDAVLTMVDTLLDNVDLLVDAALQLGIGIALGLIDALPVIVEKIPEIIEALISALISAIPKISDAGVKLLGALVKNLPKIIANTVFAVPRIILALTKKFINAVPKMAQVGIDLMKGIGRGILEGAAAPIRYATNIANRIIGIFRRIFDSHSPSRVMMKEGKYIDEGLAIGIADNAALAEQAVEDLGTKIAEPLSANIGYNAPNTMQDMEAVLEMPTGGQNSEPARDLTVILELDRMQLGRAVYRLNNEETQRVGVNLAGGFA